jgi:hypothetical protein
MIWMLKAGLTVLAVLVLSVLCFIPLYFGGYISRQLVVAASPDGSREAVCRGWYPHGMEYEMWLRRRGEWFGQRIGKVGTESMGRCAAVAWSLDGRMIAASTTGGHVTLFDAAAEGVIGSQRTDPLVYRGSRERPYTTPRMVTALAFESERRLRIETCDRLWSSTHRSADAVRCGGNHSADVVPVRLEAPRGIQRAWAVKRTSSAPSDPGISQDRARR